MDPNPNTTPTPNPQPNPSPNPNPNQRKMDGVFKLYNVGQDTKFEPGGDKETSYMYELGRPNPHPNPNPKPLP